MRLRVALGVRGEQPATRLTDRQRQIAHNAFLQRGVIRVGHQRQLEVVQYPRTSMQAVAPLIFIQPGRQQEGVDAERIAKRDGEGLLQTPIAQHHLGAGRSEVETHHDLASACRVTTNQLSTTASLCRLPQQTGSHWSPAMPVQFGLRGQDKLHAVDGWLRQDAARLQVRVARRRLRAILSPIYRSRLGSAPVGRNRLFDLGGSGLPQCAGRRQLGLHLRTGFYAP